MKKIYLLSAFSSLLLAENSLPKESPLDLGYETQREEKLLKKHLSTIKKNSTQIDKLQVTPKNSPKKIVDLGPGFILNGVSIKGNTTFKNDTIIALVKPYVGKKVYTTTLQEITSKITQLYHKNGYLTSRCILPKQNVKNGNVQFQIIEDKLGAIVIAGEKAHEYNARLFSKYFQKLQGKIINANELNEKLKLLQYLPISKVTPSLKEVRPGISNLVLFIKESKQKISLSFNNMGSKYNGEYRGTITGSINNIVGISDSLLLSATTTQTPQNYTAVSASYRHPIGENGARLSWAISQLNYQLDPDEVGTQTVFYDGSSFGFGLTYSKPLFIIDKIGTWFHMGFEYKRLDSRTLENKNGNILVHSLDKTSVLFTKISASMVDPWKGYNTFSAKVIQAVPNLFDSMTQEDINRKTYRIEEDSSFEALAVTGPLKYGKNLSAAFNKIYLSASRQQFLPKHFTAQLSLNAQYTKKRIPKAYEFSTGDFGYSGSTGIQNNFGTKFISIGAFYSYTKVYRYNQDLSTSTTSSKSPVFKLNLSYKDFYLTLINRLELASWDGNNNKWKFNIGYSW